MSNPSNIAADTDTGAVSHASTPSAAAAADEVSMGDIPRRPMRVKVLYTFDDQNKSNCLARLPSVLDVPVVSLDENTEVGVIGLRTCIQAIVAASPELVAKLGHDFTVYAYDFSEYETPLVGQGMLSWILASASSTPNAPAGESQTMVTGRVCKNILGLFANGIKETLEVKLKLVPVPTCLQKEYVENMERYHSLSQLMPDGFDYSAWSDFLKENPTLGQLAQPSPSYFSQPIQGLAFGGVEPFHQMLTRQSPSQDIPGSDTFYDTQNMFDAQPTRAASPAMSTLSFNHYQYNHDSRPASRASTIGPQDNYSGCPSRSEAAPPPQHFPFNDPFVMEEQEEGPPKKRARITQVRRPKKTPLTAHNESLRVTASTAASVRLHRPALSNSAIASELIPRAPTPRPGKPFAHNGERRPPAPSALRHASTDGGQPYMSPYDTTAFSDNALDSADERDESPGGTPLDIPSSPPLVPPRTISPTPSSPTLPHMSFQADSGFVSDQPIGREANGLELDGDFWNSDLPTAQDEKGRKPDGSTQVWQHMNPGPMDRLPQSYVAKPKLYHRKNPTQSIAVSIEQETGTEQALDPEVFTEDFLHSSHLSQEQTHNDIQTTLADSEQTTHRAPTDSFSFGSILPDQPQEASQGVANAESPDTVISQTSLTDQNKVQAYSRSATPNVPPKRSRPAKPRGLPRSQTWSGAAEPMSDAPTPADPNNSRSGSGAKRKKHIKDKLEAAIAAGEMPTHCANCGEIDTPTWRKAYTRLELGSPEHIVLSTDTAGTDIIAYEVIEPLDDNESEPKYRVFKNNLTREEKTTSEFEMLNLCNPCGLWLIKKFKMRPRKQWDKSERQTKRKRNRGTGTRSKSMSHGDELVSDAVMPDSESFMLSEFEENDPSFHRAVDGTMPPPSIRERTGSFQAASSSTGADTEVAQAALQRALRSSPAGVRGSKQSPIDIDADLTPKPTRRLLFPSPRKIGETKSLSSKAVAPATLPDNIPNSDANNDDVPKKAPRCQRCKRLKRSCDRERPCKRCDNADIGYEGCVPCELPRTNWFEHPTVHIAAIETEHPDKENCPPPTDQEDDGLAHLFEDPVSPKTTPKKDNLLQELLKTPTPGSRRRAPLTPRRAAEDTDILFTPSRNILTPRGTRATTIAPETPFTRQLNALLSDCPISSPLQGLDFSFPTFNTPGRDSSRFSEFLNEDFLSSDMVMPSSPPKGGSLGLGFQLYEDPNTSTAGLWSGASMFGSDTAMPDLENTTHLKMNVGGITVDFAAMIEEVVAANQDNDAEMDVKPGPESPEAPSQGLVKTPEEPVND